MRKNNKGLTLIELVVTIAIIAIFSGVILTFIGTGANSYRSTSSNAEAQREVQQALDQIQNIVIDANRSVYYAYGNGINDGIEEPILSDIDDGLNRSKTFFVTSAVPVEVEGKTNTFHYTSEVVEWDNEVKKLYYGCRVWDGTETPSAGRGEPDPTTGENPDVGAQALSEEDEPASSVDLNGDAENVKSTRTGEITTEVDKTVLAEDIIGFEVDISKAASERIVRFQLTTDKRGKQIKTLHTVNLRNQVQIAPPDAGYGTAQPGNAWIRITDYPPTMKPGETSDRFDCLMDGNIDLSTVKWVIDLNASTANGEFTLNSSSGAAFKVSEGADPGTSITVYVEAMTTDGKKVQSPSVVIQIVPDRVPEELIPGKNELLLGVGNTYETATLVQWTLKYSDGSTVDLDGTGLTWGVKNAPAGVSLVGDTLVIERNDTIGTASENSSFTLTASYIEDGKTLTASVNVGLARLDLVKPEGTYQVGEAKPLDYIYKEYGIEVEGKRPEISIIQCPTEAEKGYITGPDETFADKDVGEWKIQASIEIGGVCGAVMDDSAFTIGGLTENRNIVCNSEKKTTTIFAGTTYTCSYYNRDLFFIDIPLHNEWKYELVWGISGASSENTHLNRTTIVNQGDVTLDVGADEKGFVLTAKMTVYQGDSDVITHIYEGSANISVVNEIEIVSPMERVVRGRTYPLEAKVWVSSPGANGGYVREEIANVENHIRWKADNAEGFGNGFWIVSKTQVNTNITAEIEDVTSVMNGTPHTILKDTDYIEVADPEYGLMLLDEQERDSSTIFVDEEVLLHARPTADDKEYTPYYMAWTVTYNGNPVYNVQDILTGNGNDRIFKLPQSSEAVGTYVITVSYTTPMQPQKTITANYTVEEKTYTLTPEIVFPKMKTYVYPGETIDFWLKLQTEKEVVDGAADWSVSPKIENGLVASRQEKVKEVLNTFKAPTTSGSYTLTANYSNIAADYLPMDDKQGSISVNIYVTPLTMNVVNLHNELYPGTDPEKITAQILGEGDMTEDLTSEYDIEWSFEPQDAAFSLDMTRGSTTNFKVDKSYTGETYVVVTAIAKSKGTDNIVCSGYTQIKINNKKTIVVTYNLSAGVEQLLFNSVGITDSVISGLGVSFLTKISNTPVPCPTGDIPTLKLSGSSTSDLKVLMNSDAEASRFDDYKYILISADLGGGKPLYNFYIYPVKNNVFDRNGNPVNVFVPGDTESIKTQAVINGDGYSFAYKDSSGKNCELRQSIHRKTGIGNSGNNGVGSNSGNSMSKWFMLRDNTYYVYNGTFWNEYVPKDASKYDQKVQSYWDINGTITLKGEGKDNTFQNKIFWQKWN